MLAFILQGSSFMTILKGHQFVVFLLKILDLSFKILFLIL